MAVFVAGFWVCVGLLFYAWMMYPALLWALCGVRRASSPVLCNSMMPPVSIIIAVHDEASVLAARLQNCLDLDYPPERLEIIVASDGSRDETVAIANAFARTHGRIRVLAWPHRAGKTAVQNAAVACSRGEIVVFSDADTRFDPHFLRRLVRGFADPRVGCASGALVWTNPDTSSITAVGTLYWRVEHLLWRWESRLGVLAWGSGACLAVRRELLAPIDARYGEDCVVPLDAVSQGRRVVFQDDAKAYEPRIANAQAEMRARARMTLRSFAGTLSHRHLLNPFRFPGIAWSVVSHKLLRWLTPYLLVTVLVCNTALVLRGCDFYRPFLAGQLLFYLAAVTGYICDRCRIGLPGLSTAYAFCLMNLGVLIGVAHAVLGREIISYQSDG
jgi:cellulose synthase/poly-beta-1,6-N-acetylglucosamine synthase-like glycosyltransferase